MTAVFISYRRDDGRDASGRITCLLGRCFGEDAIFRDAEAIEAGADFARTILDAVRAASVMLVVIGPRWLEAPSEEGGRRLEEPEDFVRREVETALAWRVPIVPVLIDSAVMPAEAELPPSICKLALRQAHSLMESDPDEDIEELAGILEKTYDVEPLPRNAASYLGGRLQRLRRYPFDLVRLVLGPKRFLATRSLGRQRDSIDALIFLAVSTVLAVWLAIAEWPGKSWLLFVSGISVAGVAALILSLPLYLAWRIAGAGREYGRVLTILSYQFSLVHLVVGLSGLAFFSSINFTDPELLRRVKEAISEGGAGGSLQQELDALITNSGVAIVGPYLVGLLVAAVVWMIRSWGAYRRSLGLSRLRALVAFVLTVLLISAPILLSATTARAMSADSVAAPRSDRALFDREHRYRHLQRRFHAEPFETSTNRGELHGLPHVRIQSLKCRSQVIV